MHKFGGTCVAAAERVDAVCRYLVEGAAADQHRQGPSSDADASKLVVVSAMGSHHTSPVKVRALACVH